VLVVGRSADRGAAVLAALNEAGPGAGHALLRADLALLRETARAADQIAGQADRLDAVVLCAGVLSTVAEWTDEELERSFVLNYLSRYLLLRRLLPLLAEAPAGRVVLVANAGRYRDTLDLDDLQLRHGGRGLRVAGRTQFANDLLAVELVERVRGSRIEVTCVFPGLVATDVFRNARGVPGPIRAAAIAMQRLIAASPASAAQTPVFLARDPDATGVGGAFFGPGRRRRRIPGRARTGAPRCGRPARSSSGPGCSTPPGPPTWLGSNASRCGRPQSEARSSVALCPALAVRRRNSASSSSWSSL
jgi:NAD(P)-dependent dehydrogenase (short-subunit alcohol dehydrogenase family)